jgi:hypothetical protein
LLIRRFEVHGMSGLGPTQLEGLDRVVKVAGTPRARQALADALRLAMGAWSARGCREAFEALGCPVELEGEGLPDEIHLLRPERIAPLLDPDGDRTLRMELELELDPPQFGRLRELAVRHPALVDALSGGARLTLGLGWVFTQDFSVAAFSIHRPRLGEVALDLEGGWAPGFLAGLAGRGRVLGSGGPRLEDIAAADRSGDPDRRRALSALREALRRPPLSLGELRLVEAGGESWLCFDDDLLPLTALGPGAEEEVALAAGVFLDRAEILVVDRPGARSDRPRALRVWLARQAEEQGSPLEQLWMLGVGDDLRVHARGAQDRSGLRFPVRRVR